MFQVPVLTSQMPSKWGEELSFLIPVLWLIEETFRREVMPLTVETAGETRPDEHGLELRLNGESENGDNIFKKLVHIILPSLSGDAALLILEYLDNSNSSWIAWGLILSLDVWSPRPNMDTEGDEFLKTNDLL